ncbi:2Fe-2S iron-sulfur cluster-binding protein [Cryptosporangium sp. NPDC051539]|uniref:2Fe-2S iron-sulfur cluster-binding protein n=1 Tax=Cryptosporangium sp. NPDC051539 TaxID=3363962 RepID=UPI0037936F37
MTVSIYLDGTLTFVAEGQTLGALLFSLGVFSTAGAPRCGIGVCDDCLVTVDGTDRIKACLTPVRDGMNVRTS